MDYIEIILCVLLGFNIFIEVFDRLTGNKITPLSSMEFHFFMYDKQKELEKILDKQQQEVLKEMFETHLKTKDAIKNEGKNKGNF